MITAANNAPVPIVTLFSSSGDFTWIKQLSSQGANNYDDIATIGFKTSGTSIIAVFNLKDVAPFVPLTIVELKQSDGSLI